jgi:DNA/RNA-binding domain of Phe-tRNA-synthetase-like protein
MKVIIADEIREMFPELRIAVLACSDVDNQSSYKQTSSLLADEARLLSSWLSESEVANLPEIQAWQETYSIVGHKPKKNRPSAENLIRSVLAGNLGRSISPVVDIYLAAQLRWRLPIGGYDLSKTKGNVVLRRSPGGERFRPIGSATDGDPTKPGEVVYADDEGVLTRRWNWRDGDRAKITGESRSIVLMSEAPSLAIPTESLIALIEFLSRYLRDLCCGNVIAKIIDSSQVSEVKIKVDR